MRGNSKKAVKKQSLIENLPQNEGERLELIIKMTQRAIDRFYDKALVDQLERLKLELKNWKRLQKG